jgi:hypothetical protein
VSATCGLAFVAAPSALAFAAPGMSEATERITDVATVVSVNLRIVSSLFLIRTTSCGHRARMVERQTQKSRTMFRRNEQSLAGKMQHHIHAAFMDASWTQQ